MPSGVPCRGEALKPRKFRDSVKLLPWVSARLTPASRCCRASVVDSDPTRAKSAELSRSTVTGSLSGSTLRPARGVGATTTTSLTGAG